MQYGTKATAFLIPAGSVFCHWRNLLRGGHVGGRAPCASWGYSIEQVVLGALTVCACTYPRRTYLPKTRTCPARTHTSPYPYSSSACPARACMPARAALHYLVCPHFHRVTRRVRGGGGGGGGGTRGSCCCCCCHDVAGTRRGWWWGGWHEDVLVPLSSRSFLRWLYAAYSPAASVLPRSLFEPVCIVYS